MPIEEEKKLGLPGKRHSLMTVKMRIEEETAMKVAAMKPRTLSMSTFCALLVEYGFVEWEKAALGKEKSEP
jgi:hypothetical protein